MNPSNGYKWTTLISAAVTLVFLGAAAIRENVTADWRHLQADYKKILLSKAKDDAARRAAERFPVEIRQVSVPALNVVDRCVACHNGIDDPRMAGEANPHKTHPGGLLEKHRVDQFGCTICHQGQGAALSFEEAKAEDQFWDYPLLPKELTQASCGSCHDPRALPAGSAPKLVRGMALFAEKGCSSCHKLDGKGGPLGPALDNVGLKTKHQFVREHLAGSQTVWGWLGEHFRDPAKIVPASLMPNPALNEPDIEALTVYMLSLRERELPSRYIAHDKIEQQYAALHPPEPDGKVLYQRFCTSCHDFGLSTRWDKKFARFIPAIRNQAFLRFEDDECLMENIREGRPGTRMPGWGPKAGGLTEAEVTALTAYLRKDAPQVSLPTAPARGSAEHGKALFNQECAGCHGVDGKGLIAPSLANPVFQKSATDAFIAQTIRVGRENTPMPAFAAAGFGDTEIGDVLAYVRQWEPRGGGASGSTTTARK